MKSRILLLTLLLLVIACGVEAQPYPPGYLSPNFTLSRIAPSELQQACQWLEQGKLQEARRALEAALHRDPRLYVAAFGWLQTTTPQERQSLARTVEKALQHSPSAMNYFKAAVLYYYMAYDTEDLVERGTRFQRSGEYARKAYQLAPDPYLVVLIHDYPVPDILKMLEEQMGALLGKQAMRVYQQAKHNRWQTDALPPSGHLSQQQLRLLRAIVGLTYPKVLVAESGWISEYRLDPKNPRRVEVGGRFTPHGVRLRDYFRRWVTAIEQAAGMQGR